MARMTTAPCADVAPYHNRQIVLLRPEDWAAWIHFTKPEDELLRLFTAGSLVVQIVREGRA